MGSLAREPRYREGTAAGADISKTADWRPEYTINRSALGRNGVAHKKHVLRDLEI